MLITEPGSSYERLRRMADRERALASRCHPHSPEAASHGRMAALYNLKAEECPR